MPNDRAADGADGADDVVHGFPHLSTVRTCVTALYRRLSADGVRRYATSVPPADVAFGDEEDLHLGAQRVARALVHHLGLPEARMVVSFREMEHAASVELTAGPEYFVELNDRFRRHRRDVGAALAHEITHVFLHRLDLGFPGTRENEILTDVVTSYLGAGWLLLDAFRRDAVSSQKLGYLTPEEFGYVLAERAALFGEDPSPWFTSPHAYQAWTRGREEAARHARRPPLAAAGWAARHRYAKDRRYGRAAADAAYAFEGTGASARVAFPCPVCHQRLRLPMGRSVRARCGVCGTVLDCAT
ncbi:hypothetical protein ACFYV5_25870 [Streptomyces sp. NPDC003035]|uniref:hypothetical protein n=1 Tax=Streptomyces sp. NPDC003035 TaxID=3364676 RepID=UPI0036A6CDD6